MRFVKRFILLVILILISFFVYRLINPTGAKALMYDLKSFTNEKIGTHFSLTGEVLVPATGTILDATGTILENTGILQEFSDEELLLTDVELLEDALPTPTTGTNTSGTNISTGVTSPTVTPTPVVVPPTPTPTTVVKPTTPVKKPAKATNNDLNTFLDNFRR